MNSRRSFVRTAAAAVCVALVAAMLGVSSPRVAAQDCPVPDGATGCWQVDATDEFAGSLLDPAVWEPGWFVDEGWSGPVNARENACYNTDQVSVGGGVLTIQLDPTTDPACLDKADEVVELVGGVVSARDAINDPDHPMRLDDGFYVEARVKLPSSDGDVLNWPAFWTAGFGPWPVTGEIDIAEGLGGQAKYNYHYACGGGNCQVGGTPHPVASGDGEWHTYAAMRSMATTNSRATITYFFDGDPVFTLADDVVASPQYVIFSYTSHQTNTPLQTGVALEVDRVRAWSPTDVIAGDASCTGGVNIVDALLIAQFAALIRTDTGSCPLSDPVGQVNASAADLNDDGVANIVDALIIAQCVTGVGNPNC